MPQFDRQSARRISSTVLGWERRDAARTLRRGMHRSPQTPGLRAAVSQSDIARDNFGLVRPSNFSGDFNGLADVQIYNPAATTIWTNALVYYTSGATRSGVPELVAVWTNSPTVFVGRTSAVVAATDPVIPVNFPAPVDGFAVVLPPAPNVINWFEWAIPEIGTPIMFREYDDPLGGFIAVNIGCHTGVLF